ncbi:hypothetical protein QVD17_10606 [Tagetes erecta]|uniref:C2H2-type domain-containing protein n=1 Tax=Tagetes erecta TaxID=13708 RepID=A0AAD8L6M8_TARER|nr:hypothetical protein QVD17_10606 [Tagetes erecta]
MSNLIQEMIQTDQELMNHICELCHKSFCSGRSLAGHMRSHVINSTDHNNHNHDHHQQQQMKKIKNKQMKMKMLSSVNNGSLNSSDVCYELRKDPKKTTKVKDSSEVNNNNCLVVFDKLCKECGKGFQSWKALFGHMKCHSDKVSKNNMKQNQYSSTCDLKNSGRIKKSRSRNKGMKWNSVTSTTTTTTVTTASSSISMNAHNHASTSIVSDVEQDQESEIAMCLMMLSRDDRKWGNEIESYDHCNSSAFVKLSKVEGKKVNGNGSKIKKIDETEVGVDCYERSELGFTGLGRSVIKDDKFDEVQDSSKRKFECITCNKSFHSYQALGGHKASHKKLKEGQDSKLKDDNMVENKPSFDHERMINGLGAKPSDNDQTTKKLSTCGGSLKKTVVLGAHECAICLKVFSSGQALGGHKRSHMIAEAKLNQQTSLNLVEKVNEPVHETRGFIDLNMLPYDTMEEDMIKPWHWVVATKHESTTLLGLLSTS